MNKLIRLFNQNIGKIITGVLVISFVLLIINVNDQYVITAFGETTIMENFKNKTLEVLTNAEVICEEPIQ